MSTTTIVQPKEQQMSVQVHPVARATRLMFLVASTLTALVWGPLVGEAFAGSFTVRTCHGSSNQSVPTSDGAYGWQPLSSGNWAGYGPDRANGCAQSDTGAGAIDNALVAINDQSVARQANSAVGWGYAAAPGTSVAGYRLWMHGGSRPSSWDGSDGAVVLHTTPFSAYDKTIGFGGEGGTDGSTDWTGPPWVDVSGKNANGVQLWAICGGQLGTVCPAGGPGVINAFVRIYKAQMTMVDNSFPSSSAASGDAISHTTWHGSQSLAFNATDSGSGVYRLLVQSGTDAGSLSTQSTAVLYGNGGQCQDENPANGDPYEFTAAQPCSPSVSSDTHFNTTALADGDQVVRLQVEDAAGNRTTVYGPATKTVDNLPPVVGVVAVSGPTAREGETLTCSAAVQGQSPALAFRWLRANADGSDAVEIAGAAGSTYAVGAADIGKKVRCVLTARDGGGEASGTSGLTDGPFGSGHVVVPYCTGRPTGPRDECGDLDGDGIINRLDPDIDGDGAGNGTDPDPWDPSVRPTVVTPGDGGAGGSGENGAAGHNGVVGKQGEAGPQGETGTPAHPGPPVTEAARKDLNVVPVANPTAGSGLNGTPADDEAVVVAYFERGTGKRRVVSGTATAGGGERLRIRGTLKTHDGKPISGAKVFLAQKKPTGEWKIDGGTVSRQNGSLLMFTRKGGLSRQLRLVYFPRDGRDGNRGSTTLGLKIRQGARLSLSRTTLHNRDTLRFTGEVDGVVTGKGPLVQVQVKLAAGWSTFSSTRASKARHGRFAVSYRFLRTTRRTIYRFRVRVAPATATGYVGGTSKARKVVVLP